MKQAINLFILPRRFIVVMVICLAAISFAGANLLMAATAEKSPPPAAKPSHIERTEAQIKQLHDTLKITPAQEELWNNLAQVMLENAKAMDDLLKARTDKTQAMNALEDIKSYSQITDAHAEGLKKFIPPFEALYNAMSDEQKKNADTLFKRERHGRSKKK